MGRKVSVFKGSIASFLIFPVLTAWLTGGCIHFIKDTDDSGLDDITSPRIEQINVTSSPSETVVDIVNSEMARYSAFKVLEGQPRIILNISAIPSINLPAVTEVNDGNLENISFAASNLEEMTTRIEVELAGLVDYTVTSLENVIQLRFTPVHPMAKVQDQSGSSEVVSEQAGAEYGGSSVTDIAFVPLDPRILLTPRQLELNEVIGLDFILLENGRSRLIVTSEKKVNYILNRKDANTLVLTLTDTTIQSLLLREIDTSHFNAAIDRITPALSSENGETLLVLSLREVVPYHVKQDDGTLHVDFEQSSIMPPEMEITPMALARNSIDEPQEEGLERDMAAAVKQPLAPEKIPVIAEMPVVTAPETVDAAVPAPPEIIAPAAGKAEIEKASSEQVEISGFTGEPMYLDFVNADVTHILRLINEVSKENIIWDPSIEGSKISMVLNDVPWDEALELILKNNNLAKRYVGKNILWITTKVKMDAILAAEESEEAKLQKKAEEERRKELQAQEEAKEMEPLITAFIPIDFADAAEIRGHLILTDRGSMSIDTRSNTLIMKDTAESIEEAKATVAHFDMPVKQIMIEARIVDASSSFSKDLGVQWTSIDRNLQKNTGTAFGTDPTAFTTPGDFTAGGSFTSNTPTGWAGNLNLSFARLTDRGLGTVALDMAIALAETEGKARIMSAPKVIAREGTSATISSGDVIVIPATENVASTTLDATLSLTVTPTTVSYNGYITMDVNVTDDLAPSTSRLLKKSINTTLMIKSGDTVVIGGIIKESESEDESGIPLLRKIPGLGWLFSAKSRVQQKSELLIFLTPTVLPSPVKPLDG
jgi:type IV pilus assembly protein PilQ